MYKLIAVDMDGTLLRKDKTISTRTKAAIQRAVAKGVKVVLASGRPLAGLERYLEELHLVSNKDYVLSFNGALIQNVSTEEIVFKDILTGKDLKRLYELSKSLGLNIHAFTTQGLIAPKMSEYTEVESNINQIPVQIVDFNTIKDEEEVIKVMFVDETSVLEKAIEKLPQALYEDYTVVRSAPFFLEFLNKSASKGTGVKVLADHLGIKQSEVICIGDAGNDLDMIQFAGLGVAMANAFDEVKEVADYITTANEEDGVAHVIEKFI